MIEQHLDRAIITFGDVIAVDAFLLTPVLDQLERFRCVSLCQWGKLIIRIGAQKTFT
jgi:hypothetical protein